MSERDVAIRGAVVEEEYFLEIYTALLRDVDTDVAISTLWIGAGVLDHVGEVMV